MDQQKSIVCKFNKTVYGLKQSSRMMNGKIKVFLLGLGYKRFNFKHSVYTKDEISCISKKESVGMLLYLTMSQMTTHTSTHSNTGNVPKGT